MYSDACRRRHRDRPRRSIRLLTFLKLLDEVSEQETLTRPSRASEEQSASPIQSSSQLSYPLKRGLNASNSRLPAQDHIQHVLLLLTEHDDLLDLYWFDGSSLGWCGGEGVVPDGCWVLPGEEGSGLGVGGGRGIVGGGGAGFRSRWE